MLFRSHLFLDRLLDYTLDYFLDYSLDYGLQKSLYFQGFTGFKVTVFFLKGDRLLPRFPVKVTVSCFVLLPIGDRLLLTHGHLSVIIFVR